MRHLADAAVLAALLTLCWRGYRHRAPWFTVIARRLLRAGRNRGFPRRLLAYGPLFVGWLLLCHWTDVKGWHATAAGLMALAMTVGLDAMRQFEEERKRNRHIREVS